MKALCGFFDGTQKISDPISVFLVLLGSVTLARFILPYVAFLMFSAYIQPWVNSTRLNAYVDASLAPYKNKRRFLFGVRLILISIVYIVIANRDTNNPTFTLTLELSLLVGFALIQAYIHPFKSFGVALLDMSFLLNLIARTLATSYTIQNEGSFHDQDIIILCVALLTYVGIILWHILRKLHKNRWVKKKGVCFVTRFIKAPKLKKVRGIMEMMAKMDGNMSAVSEREVPQDERGYSSGHSDRQTPTTTMTLQDMVAAPDERQLHEEPSSPKLRDVRLVLAYIG